MTTEELARAVRAEQMDFVDALLEFLSEHHPEQFDEAWYWTLTVAIGYAAIGRLEQEITLPDGEKLSVREVIGKFGLEAFVEP